jgi:hypothetical protein
MLLGLDGKIVTNAFCLFDMPYPYGISGREKEVNKREIKVNDKDVLELQTFQWQLFKVCSPVQWKTHRLQHQNAYS